MLASSEHDLRARCIESSVLSAQVLSCRRSLVPTSPKYATLKFEPRLQLKEVPETRRNEVSYFLSIEQPGTFSRSEQEGSTSAPRSASAAGAPVG